jgi:hypothetical protein
VIKGSGVRKRGERMFYCTCVYMRRSSLDLCLLRSWIKESCERIFSLGIVFLYVESVWFYVG